jgi:transposase InsO family protein
MAKVLEVSVSGYYQWRKHERSARDELDEQLIPLIKEVHKSSYESYGVRRIVRHLKHQGIVVNPKRIRRLMRFLGLKGKGEPKRQKFIKTTDSEHSNPVAPNELNREFTLKEPNKCWVSDITYLWTLEGWVYLAVVMDLYNRKVVGWAISESIDTELVSLALERAVVKRNPAPGLLLHSDRGVQYTSISYRALVRSCGMRQSMSRKGNCWDNAVAESFFRSLKVEVIRGLKLTTVKEAETVIFEYIEEYYNNWRVHSSLGYMSPVQYEALYRGVSTNREGVY